MASNMLVHENSSSSVERHEPNSGQMDWIQVPVVGNRRPPSNQNENENEKPAPEPSKKSFALLILAVSALESMSAVLQYVQNSLSAVEMACFLSALFIFVLFLIFVQVRILPLLVYLLLQSSLVYVKNLSSTDHSLIPLAILMYASRDTIIKTQLNFLFIHSAVIGLHIYLNWFSMSLLWNAILFLVFSWTLAPREKGAEIAEGYKDVGSSDIEELQSFINKSTKNLADLMKEVPLKSYEKLINVKNTLSHIMTLATSEHLYRPKFESITNDLEEIIYLQENFNIPFTRSFSNYNCLDNYREMENHGFLKHIGNTWNFDSFFLDKCTGRPIESAAIFVLKQYSLQKCFGIHKQKTTNFFKKVEDMYLDNPYHNAVHAADVLSSYLFLIRKTDLMAQMTAVETLSGIVASTAHDIAHPGYTNRFLVNSKSPLAILYNDTSVLEMMHASKVFEIMREGECDILETLQEEDWVFCRKLIIGMILATDMVLHFEMLGQFKAKSEINLKRQEDRVLAHKLCIKAADIGHSAKNWTLHKKWTCRVIEEFFKQGDREKEMGLAVSMFCDRENTNVSKCQVGFIKNISLPLYLSLKNQFASESIQDNCVQQLNENLQKWEGKLLMKRTSYISIKWDKQDSLLHKGLTNCKKDSFS